MYKLLKLKIGEQNLCPFPHKKVKTGEEYMEKVPSCGINEDGAFNCFVCGRGFTNENWFTAAYLNCSYKQAEKFNKTIKEMRLFLPQKKKWKKHQERLKEEMKNDDSEIKKYIKNLGIENIINESRLGIYQNKLTLPYVFKGQIINLTQFCPGEVPKYRNSQGSLSGSIATTKLFKKESDYILICAGEKDMLVATSRGFNAISLLGGEKAKPTYNKNIFKEKKVYIAYDNDKAGKEGALDFAEWLYRYTKHIKVLNISDIYNEKEGDLNEIIKEEKEDITDFFVKYKKNDIDLYNIIDNTNWYQPPALENQSIIELTKNIKKTLKELDKKLKEKQYFKEEK